MGGEKLMQEKNLERTKKSVKETLSGILFFTFFMLTWIPINIICLFKKDLAWEPIKHNRSMDINDIKN